VIITSFSEGAKDATDEPDSEAQSSLSLAEALATYAAVAVVPERIVGVPCGTNIVWGLHTVSTLYLNYDTVHYI
jgi:hypothetical protein